MQLQMEPQSSETIPASSQNSVKQKIHVKNPNNVRTLHVSNRIKPDNIVLNGYIPTGGSKTKVQSYVCPAWSRYGADWSMVIKDLSFDRIYCNGGDCRNCFLEIISIKIHNNMHSLSMKVCIESRYARIAFHSCMK